MAKLDGKILDLLLTAAAKDSTRFQMHSVYLDPEDDHVAAVATDGKRMVLAQCEGNGIEAPVIVSAEHKGSMNRKASGATHFSSDDLGRVSILDGQTQAAVLVDGVVGTYPEYKRVLESLDKNRSDTVMRFNPRLLGEMLMKLSQAGVEIVEITPSEDGKGPIKLAPLGQYENDVAVILMPIVK